MRRLTGLGGRRKWTKKWRRRSGRRSWLHKMGGNVIRRVQNIAFIIYCGSINYSALPLINVNIYKYINIDKSMVKIV